MKNLLQFLVVFAVGCSGGVEKELSALVSTPISLPTKSTITFEGRDTTIADYFESDYKMVVYTDSTGCSSCTLSKLFLWEDLIKYADSYKGKLKFYFIFNPPKGENLRRSLRTSLLEYPMLLDSLGEFELLNSHLPKNKAMHSFLLDEDNNVILVGNPLQNPQIEKMFKEEVQKRLGAAAN